MLTISADYKATAIGRSEQPEITKKTISGPFAT
jgi:hypothetical protein